MAAGNTYEAIATNTLASATSTVSFTSIPSTYTDLRLVITGTSESGSTIDAILRFNSDSSSLYSATYVYGNGTSAASGYTSNATFIYVTQVTAIKNVQTNRLLDIQNYSNTTTFKTLLSRENDTTNATAALVGLYRSTSAISSIQITGTSGGNPNFAIGTTFNLYGIKAA